MAKPPVEVRWRTAKRVATQPPLQLPQPAIVALSGVAAGAGAATGDLTVTLGVATEVDSALAVLAVHAIDSATMTESAEVEKFPADDTATSGDYGLVLVPLGMGLNLFGVLATVADPATGAVWGVALFLVTILAMRDPEFDKLVARLADFLRPPSD